MTTPTPRDTVTSDDVLDQAMALLRDGGATDLSMRRLAAALGVSTQVVYSRVGGKPEVVRELHDRAFHALAARVGEPESAPGTRAHVHEVAQFYFDHAVADPVRFELMFGTPIAEFQRDADAVRVEIDCFRRTWLASVRAFLDRELPGREGPMAVRLAYRLWTVGHGITTVHLAGHSSPDDDPEAELHAVIDLLLDAAVATT